MKTLPKDFDVALIGDDSRLPADALDALRELAWRRAKSDPLWFLQNFWHIETVGKGYQLFNLYDFQKQDVEVFAEAIKLDRAREVRLKARQIGYTTETMGLAFHNAFFNPYHSWLAALQTEDDAQAAISKMMKVPYSMLPLWMRDRGPQPTTQNMDEFSLDNGSQILVVAATPKAGRSKAVFGVILDENAFQEYAEEMLAALDPLCYGPMFVFSTANGMGNPFHKLWLEAQKPDSEWNQVVKRVLPDEPWHGAFRPWHVVPNRDEVWYKREKRKARGREHLFYQEYPETPEEAFAKSGRTALPIDLLRDEQMFEVPQIRLDLGLLDVYNDTLNQWYGRALLDVGDEADMELWLWDFPQVERDGKLRVVRDPNYVIGCDIAEGLEHGDRTSITIWNANTLEVVGSFRGHYPVEDLGELLEFLGYWYHTALLIPERNNFGLLPLDYLRRANYPRLYRMDFIAQQVVSDRTIRYGWHTNKATKPKMVNDFIRGLRDGHILVHDPRFFEEAQTFISNGKGGFEAANGSHDDHVLGHLLGYQGCLDVGRYPIVWQDEERGPTTWNDMIELQHWEAAEAAKTRRLDQGIGSKRMKRHTQPSFFVNV